MELILGIIIGAIAITVLRDPKRRQSLIDAFKPAKKEDDK